MAENGPRKTSMRSAVSRLKVAAWPWPPGMVAGMPSAIRRRPRTPKAERAPKPRAEICKSWATFWRFATSTPGTAASASEAFTRGWLSCMRAASTTSMAYGSLKLARPTRVPVTSTVSSGTPGASAFAPAGIVDAAMAGAASALPAANRPAMALSRNGRCLSWGERSQNKTPGMGVSRYAGRFCVR
jgi:hypothetical protein